MPNTLLPAIDRLKPVNPQLNRSHPLARGMQAAYLFDNQPETGNLVDYSENFNTGNSFSNITYSSSPHGGAAVFNGTTGFITCRNSGSLNNLGNGPGSSPTGAALTLAGWIYINGPGQAGGTIASKLNNLGLANGWLFSNNTTTSLSFSVAFGGTDLIFRWAVPFQQWFHFVFNYPGNLQALRCTAFVNGISAPATASTNATGGREDDSLQPLIIGDDPTINTAFDGQIESLYFYNRTLTPGEAKALYFDNWQMFRPSMAQRAYFYRPTQSTAVVVYNAPRMLMGMGI